MSLPELIFFCVVIFIGVPSALRLTGGWRLVGLRNWTAGALVASFVFGWSLYLITGQGMPLDAMFVADIFVLTVILSKDEWEDRSPYRGLLHQLAAMYLERSPWDRRIVTIFPVMWVLYLAPVSDFHRYWGLWWLALAQFLLAAGEPLELAWRKAKASRAETPSVEPMEFRAWGLAAHG